MRPMESRLLDALENRASQVTEDTLVRHHADPTRTVVPIAPRRDQRRKGALVLVAAAVALILAGFSWVVIINRQGIPANPVPTATLGVPSQSLAIPSTSATPSAVQNDPAVPDTSHVAGTYPRTAIPWAAVGSRWTVATHHSAEPASLRSLVLVSPWGAGYTIGSYEPGETPDRVPSLDVMDVSGDGRRVLLGASNKIMLIDVPSGAILQITMFPMKDGYLVNGQFVGEDRLDGSAFVLLTSTPDGSVHRLSWYNASSGPAVRSVVTDVGSVWSSPTGRYLVGNRATGSDTIVVLDSSNGRSLMTVPTPAGEWLCYTRTTSWWSDDEFMYGCATKGATDQNAWRYSIGTETATRVGWSNTSNYESAFPTSVGVIVPLRGGCQAQPLGLLGSDGTTDTPLPHQPQHGGLGRLLDVVGDTAYLLYFGDCSESAAPAALVAFDVVAHTTITLVSSSSDGRVDSAWVMP